MSTCPTAMMDGALRISCGTRGPPNQRRWIYQSPRSRGQQPMDRRLSPLPSISSFLLSLLLLLLLLFRWFLFFFIYLFYFIFIFRSGRPIDDRVGNPKRHGRRVSLRVRWLSLNEESLCHLNAADPSNKSIVSEWVTERKRKRKRKKRGGWGFRISCQLLPLDDAVRHFASPISPASPTNCLLTTANK